VRCTHYKQDNKICNANSGQFVRDIEFICECSVNGKHMHEKQMSNIPMVNVCRTYILQIYNNKKCYDNFKKLQIVNV